MVLAQDCVVSMGLPPEIIDPQLEYINCETGTPEELASSSMSEPLFRSLWQEWPESIEAFYLSCDRYLAGLSPEAWQELLGEETAELTSLLRSQLAVFATKP
jgi:hypothetical protein